MEAFFTGYLAASMLAIFLKTIGLLHASWVFTLLPLIMLIGVIGIYYTVKEMILALLVIRSVWRVRKSSRRRRRYSL